jgi:hypothetical protein
MPHLEARRVVELARLRGDGVRDGLAAVARVHAPEPRGAVEDPAPVGGGVVHVLGADEQARRALEVAVRRERHPVRVERRADLGAERRERVSGVGHRASGLACGGRAWRRGPATPRATGAIAGRAAARYAGPSWNSTTSPSDRAHQRTRASGAAAATRSSPPAPPCRAAPSGGRSPPRCASARSTRTGAVHAGLVACGRVAHPAAASPRSAGGADPHALGVAAHGEQRAHERVRVGRRGQRLEATLAHARVEHGERAEQRAGCDERLVHRHGEERPQLGDRAGVGVDAGGAHVLPRVGLRPLERRRGPPLAALVEQADRLVAHLRPRVRRGERRGVAAVDRDPHAPHLLARVAVARLVQRHAAAERGREAGLDGRSELAPLHAEVGRRRGRRGGSGCRPAAHAGTCRTNALLGGLTRRHGDAEHCRDGSS